MHIVTFDNPFPPDYGGAIDVFYKVKALHQAGIRIYLHCYSKDRLQTEPLLEICHELYMYKKSSKITSLFSRLPLAVAVRRDKRLLNNLLATEAPILFEGLQTTWPLIQIEFDNQRTFVRAHNIEHDYYNGLASSTTNYFKKLLFKMEVQKLRSYENIITKLHGIFSLSRNDQRHFSRFVKSSKYIPVFHQHKVVNDLSDYGNYAFYHGDLSVADNLRVAKFLITAFCEIEYPLVIAGKSNLKELETLADGQNNIQIVHLSSETILKALFDDAHINICWSFQQTGTKLKVLNSLYQGRHCIINDKVVDEKSVQQLCTQVENSQSLKDAIELLAKLPYQDCSIRQEVLDAIYNTEINAKKIIDFIFG